MCGARRGPLEGVTGSSDVPGAVCGAVALYAGGGEFTSRFRFGSAHTRVEFAHAFPVVGPEAQPHGIVAAASHIASAPLGTAHRPVWCAVGGAARCVCLL